MAYLTTEESETALNLSAADRLNGGQWEIYSDDPAMITRLRRVAKPYKNNGNAGFWFRLPPSNVSFRKIRRQTGSKPPEGHEAFTNSAVNGDIDSK